MKIPYFCCIGAELKRYQKDFDFMNQVYLYKIPVEDTVEEVLSEDYFKAVSDTVLQDDIVYIYEAAAEKLHICRFNKENGHITAIKLASGIPELEPGKILVSDQNGNIAASDLSIEYIKDTLSILHCTAQLSDTVDTTTVVMLDELDAFETLDSRPSYKAAGAIVVDNFGNRGIIESVDQGNQTAVIVTIYTAVKSVNGKKGDVVLTGEDISADVSEQTDTVQGHLQTLHNNIKDIELFKFPNATIVGEPTINHGQVSGFSANNYLQFPTILDLHNKPFVIDFCFTTGNDVTTQQNILDSQFGLALAIANGKGLMAISHNGTSWAGSVVGTMNIQPNTTYYARMSWNRMNYQTQLSTDGTTYTPDMNFGSTQSPYPRTMFIGGCSGSAIGHTPHPFGGTINLNYAYLTVEGQIVWQGMDDAGLATRMDIDAGNISYAGKEKIKDIARNGNISNCITEIPQDIKLELNNGLLTLKAGSKVYVPNGQGVFDAVTITSDLGHPAVTGNRTIIVYKVAGSGGLNYQAVGTMSSGSTDSLAGTPWHIWYDTTNNIIKQYGDDGVTPSTGHSFPIAIVTVTNGTITSIDQVFNGFGYIGSTVFALPGVKGLIPNGRNEDGSLKNTNVTIPSVKTSTLGGTYNRNFIINSDGGITITTNSFVYRENENILYLNNESKIYSFVVGKVEYTQDKITSFIVKTTFHAVDYNDTEYIAHQAMPSDRYIDLTLGASGSRYTAPADGFVTIKISSTAGWTQLRNETAGGLIVCDGLAAHAGMLLPVSKGDIFEVEHPGSVSMFRFIYANGSK